MSEVYNVRGFVYCENDSLCYLQVAMAGDFILAVASMMIARLRNNDVTLVLSQVRLQIRNTRHYLVASQLPT